MYHIYVYAVPLIILAALGGFRWKAGLWGNGLTLGAVLFSVLVAIGWWEDVAELLATQAPATLFVADCLALWVLFLVTLLILDTATRYLSTVKVKYNDMVENIGNGIVLLLLFAVLYGFYLFAEEAGPVGENFDAPEPGNSVAIQIFQVLSARSQEGGPLGNLSPFTEGNQFDDRGEFRKLQLQRRQTLMGNMIGENGSLEGSDTQVGQMTRGKNK